MRTRSRFALPGISAEALPPQGQGNGTSTWVSLVGLAEVPDTMNSRPQRSHTQVLSKSIIELASSRNWRPRSAPWVTIPRRRKAMSRRRDTLRAMPASTLLLLPLALIANVDPNQQISTNPGKETAAAWNESAGSAGGVTAIAFTNSSCQGAGTCARWAATDPNNDNVWIQHSENNSADWDTSSLSFPAGDAATQWGPDPLILGVPVSGTTKTRDRFVYIGMMSSQLSPNRDIFIAVSDDGAKSFHNFAFVSKTGSRLDVDRPAAAVDPVNGTIWVQWVSDKANLPGKYWVSAITIPAAPGSAPVVGNPDSLPLPSGAQRAAHAALAVRHVDANRTEVMLAWPDDYGSGQSCPGGETYSDGYNNKKITWWFSSKTYASPGGGSWTHQVITTAADHTYLMCVDPAFLAGGTGDAAYGVGATPWLVYHPASNSRLVVLARSTAKNAKVHIHLYSSKDGVSWSDTPLTDLGNGGSHQWRPSMALVGSRLAIAYYSTQLTNTSGNISRWATIRELAARIRKAKALNIGAYSLISKAGPGQVVPWFGNGATGDYVGMAADQLKKRFVDSWSDQRGPSPPSSPTVYATRFW